MPFGSRRPEQIRFRPHSDLGTRAPEYGGQEARKAAARLPEVKRKRRLKLLRKYFR